MVLTKTEIAQLLLESRFNSCNNMIVIKNAFHVAVHNPSSLVFVAVVVSSFALAYVRARPSLTGSEMLSLVVLGIIYSIIGTLVFWAVIALGSLKYKILYLSIQFILGMVIMHLARGNGWLTMLPIVSHSVVLLSPRAALIPCLLILAGMSWSSSQLVSGWGSFIQWMVIFSSVVLFSAIFTNLAMREARAKEEVVHLAAQLEQSNRELKAYAAKAEQVAAVQERNRLAREIHDGLGHYLTAMNLQSKVASALIDQDPSQAKDAIDRLQEMTLAALADVRQSVAALHSDGMIGKHLPEALEPLITESRRAGLATELTVRGEPRPLSPALELAIYRAFQEGLTNIHKHAEASRAALLLEYRAKEIFLQIKDNGVGGVIGMDELGEARGSYGLFGLRERVQLLGGDMRIDTEPGSGFCVGITLPVS